MNKLKECIERDAKLKDHPVMKAAAHWVKMYQLYEDNTPPRNESDTDFEYALIENLYMNPDDAITGIVPGVTLLHVNFESGLELKIPRTWD